MQEPDWAMYNPVLLLLLMALPLLVLAYLLVTSDPAAAHPLRASVHAAVAVTSLAVLISSIPDGGLFIGVIGLVLAVSVVTATTQVISLMKRRGSST